ncbi:histidine kinase [Streptomyces sp. NBS 14/10]|uniref:sensor histidine kinase n=1 Tax=Streptomyces sp. NBS 14/10 TaxID=1945643 RepID=UPI000B7EA725|nr:histidine kinase [Streptomyces sp. NBS 14/10]KAK1179099.1 histidine kinase [Streptomyces sp. NBS 14/10]NUS90197.1 sensor histidine kinase [Streptomyces sp.]
MRLPTAPRAALTRLRRDAVFLLAGVSVQFLALLVLSVPWLVYSDTAMPLLGVLAAVALPLAALAAVSPAFTRMQRRRFKALLGIDIPGPARRGPELRYNLLVGPAIACGGAFVWFFALVVGLAASTVFTWSSLGGRLKFLPTAMAATYVTALGLALLALAYWLTGALVRLDIRAATALLGPDPAKELERRVEDLTERRAGTVDAADAERRRIERDLHDGAQQRLVSMAVNLGLAKATLGDLPEEARKVIDEAHREAKEAIEELNNLVRGLHPAVLDDRGLDAALSGVAARAALPVRLHVDITERPAPTVEAVAYFVVSESLANVTKHAQATGADVTVARTGDILRVVIADDGVGGADPAQGSGLTGLVGRVGSVDGTFDLSSPRGGPTVITVELPCVL